MVAAKETVAAGEEGAAEHLALAMDELKLARSEVTSRRCSGGDHYNLLFFVFLVLAMFRRRFLSANFKYLNMYIMPFEMPLLFYLVTFGVQFHFCGDPHLVFAGRQKGGSVRVALSIATPSLSFHTLFER